jgi:hypothetical protein
MKTSGLLLGGPLRWHSPVGASAVPERFYQLYCKLIRIKGKGSHFRGEFRITSGFVCKSLRRMGNNFRPVWNCTQDVAVRVRPETSKARGW